MSAAPLRIAAALCAGGLALVASSPARAGADCSVTATSVAFGTYDPLAASADDTTGTVTVTCDYVAPGGTTSVKYTVSLSAGSTGTFAERRLTAGSAILGYNLYSNNARSLMWGDGSSSTVIASGSFNIGPGGPNRSRTRDHTIYARIPALQDVAVGNYSDTIVVTLTF